jgi:hypothetical protein
MIDLACAVRSRVEPLPENNDQKGKGGGKLLPMVPLECMQWFERRIAKMARAEQSPPGAYRCDLERYPQSELNQPRQIVLTSYLTEGTAAAAAGIRRIKPWMIECVEEFSPELGA